MTIGNVEEPGEVTLTKSQPKVGVAITAVIEDPDSTSLSETWQWATSTSPTGPWYDIAVDSAVTENSQNETYKPRESDVGYYLQATASYSDGTNDPNKAMDETKDSKGAVSANRVIRADYMNEAPVFRDHDTNTVGIQIPARKVREDAEAGDPVGDPVTATDEGADGSQEKLRYELAAWWDRQW